MKSIQRFAKPISLCLAVSIFLVCVPIHGVLAALISTDTIAKGRDGQAARVRAFCQKPGDIRCGRMAFDEIVAHNRSMAPGELRRDS